METLKEGDKLQLTEKQIKKINRVYDRKAALLDTIEELSIAAGKTEKRVNSFLNEWYPQTQGCSYRLHNKTGELVITEVPDLED